MADLTATSSSTIIRKAKKQPAPATTVTSLSAVKHDSRWWVVYKDKPVYVMVLRYGNNLVGVFPARSHGVFYKALHAEMLHKTKEDAVYSVSEGYKVWVVDNIGRYANDAPCVSEATFFPLTAEAFRRSGSPHREVIGAVKNSDGTMREVTDRKPIFPTYKEALRYVGRSLWGALAQAERQLEVAESEVKAAKKRLLGLRSLQRACAKAGVKVVGAGKR